MDTRYSLYIKKGKLPMERKYTLSNGEEYNVIAIFTGKNTLFEQLKKAMESSFETVELEKNVTNNL